MNTKYVSFSSSKGGVGKSTLTTLIASDFYYRKGYKVAVLDCDPRQSSISHLRNYEYKVLQGSEYWLNLHFALLQKNNLQAPYIIESLDIKKYSIKDILAYAEKLSVENDLDILFFDLPGSADVPNMLNCLFAMDYIFIPFKSDQFSFNSCRNFYTIIAEEIKEKNLPISLYAFWNDVSISVNQTISVKLFESLNADAAQDGIEMLLTKIPRLKRFDYDIKIHEKQSVLFRSTYFPIPKTNIGLSHLPDFFLEVEDIVINTNAKEIENEVETDVNNF